ncbi:sensor histidine kinase [Nocardia huaxiensis]|uniref:sensor histidine kinase n=1 Tax=Nocardia huaxiensis TaxID=2755382 RepID=UPI001E4ADFA0|nr:histidine kinase [Nocardia huaxiensis]UFS96387.1 histidine kinase [Nocardia huaxiensis]
MNVTNATPRATGQTLREFLGGARGSSARLRRFLRNPIAEIKRNIAELPYDYPPAAILLFDIMLFGVAVVATLQRYSYFPSPLPLLALLTAYSLGPMWMVFGWLMPPMTMGVVTAVAGALYLAQPVNIDVAPFVLIAGAGQLGATAVSRVSLPFAGLFVLELIFFQQIGHLEEGEILMFLPAVLFGWMVGRMMQYQRKDLYQEREYQEIRAGQAADEERRRIAREVHDVIAHSLSITLLHVTAARHALQTDRDVDEAVDALTDAERLGRQAMADIRRTVGLLGTRTSPQTPEPGLDDIPDLVADFVGAGMEVDALVEGDPDGVTAALGLAIYRIIQESLANVAKHAPGARARVRIKLGAKDINVQVTNDLPTGLIPRPGSGMGISGMRQRITLLGGVLLAGRGGDGWRVEARIPMHGPNPPLPCVSLARGAEETVRSMMQSMTAKWHDDRPGPRGELQEGM